jgi:hypothetical protein
MNQHLQSVPECGRDSAPAVLHTQEKLRDFERQAWNACFEIARTLDTPGSGEATDEFLTTRVMPAFSKIGVDEAFIQALFGLASKAWGTLGTASENVVRLHPNMQQDIDEVRQGLLIQAERKMALHSGPAFLTPHESYDRLQATMDPANLHQLIDEIVTPWIVLPRAYTSLRRDHVHYLPAYLEMIGNETNEEALHIFTRIAIEFLANFTIRFADERYPRKQVVCLVTAGYTALFWKNLNTPPRGFEDIRIFEHFLAWLKHSGCRAKTPGHNPDAAIEDMEALKEMIFPPESDLLNRKSADPDISRFVVALRHGCKGIDCAVRYFWLTPASPHWPRGPGARWGIIIFALKSLFDLITCRYAIESKRTRYYIREFLFQLNNTYAYSVVYNTTLDKQNRADLQGLRSKIVAMIQQLQHTLSSLTP